MERERKVVRGKKWEGKEMEVKRGREGKKKEEIGREVNKE